MAGKITELTALTTGHALGDLLELVDISDTTMSAGGTNKKTTFTNLMKNVPAGTAGAPTLAFAADVTGWYRRGTDIWTWASGGSALFEMSTAHSGAFLASTWGIRWSDGDIGDDIKDAGIARTSAGVVEVNNGTNGTWRDFKFRKLTPDQTVTAGGTTGNQTINKASGTVNLAAAQTTVTVTSSQCTANSTVFATIRTNDSTATLKNVVPAAGSFVITLTASTTAETSIGFLIVN